MTFLIGYLFSCLMFGLAVGVILLILSDSFIRRIRRHTKREGFSNGRWR